MTRVLATGLSLAMAFSMAAATNVTTASAASKPAMITYDSGASAKTLSVKLGEATKIKVNAATKKTYKVSAVKVSSSKLRAAKNTAGTVVTIRGMKVTEEGKPASVKVSFKVKKTGKTSKYSYVSKVNVVDDKLTMTAAATGVKKITVSFNKEVDTTKAVITLKKGASSVNIDKVVFTDAKTAEIPVLANLTKGDYTVEATGVADEALTATVNVADDEYVKTIDITTKEAPMLSTVGTGTVDNHTNPNKVIKVRFQLLNQYEEVVNNAPASISFTASTGVAVGNDYTYKNGSGVVYITSSTPFVPNSEVYINAVMTAGTHVATANATVKVALPANYDKAEFLGVYNTRTKKIENIDAATLGKYTTAYKLLFTKLDQYGNKVDNKDGVDAATADMNVVSNNPVFVAVNATAVDFCTTVEYQDKEYQAIQLTAGTYANKGGKATISIISSKTGTTSTYDIDSNAASIVDKFTLQAPADIVTEGSTVEIPFSALDQAGNAVTSYDGLNGLVTLEAGIGGATLGFKKQSDGSAKLYLTMPGNVTGVSKDNDVLAYATSVVKSNGNFSSMTYNIKETSVPTTVVGLAKDSKIATTFTDGAADQTLKLADLNIADQYGRTMKTADVKKQLTATKKIYAVKVASEQAIELGNATNGGIMKTVATSTVDGVTIGSATTGTAKIAFGISDSAGAAVAASEKEIRFTAESGSLSSYDSYEVAALPTMYLKTDNTAPVSSGAVGNYAVDVKVYGVAADGSKILLPSSQFTVSLPTTGIATELSVEDNRDASKDSIGQNAAIAPAIVTTNKWFWTSATDSTYKDETIDVTVTIFDTNGAQKTTKTEKLTLSNKTPNIKEAKFTSDVNGTTNTAYLQQTANTISAASLAAIIDASSLKDQYGVKDATASPSAIVISEVKEASDQDGQSFRVTDNNSGRAAITGAVKNDTFKVTFKYAGGYELSCDVVVTD